MSDPSGFNEDASNRKAGAPYSHQHPVPNIERYEDRKQQREAQPTAERVRPVAEEQEEPEEGGLLESLKTHLHLNENSKETPAQKGEIAPYSSGNRNEQRPASDHDDIELGDQGDAGEQKNEQVPQDTSTSAASEQDPRKKRKNMKHLKRDYAGRLVTDPVTHLPVTIHDSTNTELKNAPENLPPAGSEPRTSTGFSAASKSSSELDREAHEMEDVHKAMNTLFPPPDYQATKEQLDKVYSRAITIGLGSILVVVLVVPIATTLVHSSSWMSFLMSSTVSLSLGLGLGGGIIWGVRGWLSHKVNNIWEDCVWDASREQEEGQAESTTPESTQWLNSLLASMWPLVNPDLFDSLADTLEDVMQASLPKLVRMISVEDLGQGSEAIRILGVRWLPTGAAAKDVSVDGKFKSGNDKHESDRKVPGQGEVNDDTKSNTSANHKAEGEGPQNQADEEKEEGDEENIAEGLEAEEGDFVNIEVAFAYRSSSRSKSIRNKAKNAHLYLVFYLPGGVEFPVWVELRGLIGTMRMRLQLCPDPPFFALCTLTLLGQPKVDLSCVPLTKKGLNIMDLPIISSFVQSSVDAALSEYVAPKSLTLDIKDMIVGDDFKKDTTARGIVVVRVKSGKEFKEGDPSLGLLKKGSADPYIAVGWAKFGKPVWSTRVIIDDMEPVWDEIAFILVGPQELNAEERLRVQLWDSDRLTADDDLGRIEVDLKELMQSPNSKGKMWDRQDGFMAMDAVEKMPGLLKWSVGYFSKTDIQKDELASQTEDPGVKDVEDLKEKVAQEARRKLREASDRDESGEVAQQQAQNLQVKKENMIISCPPLQEYPSGILSIQIHQITGLEFEKMRKSRKPQEEGSEAEEGSGDLPSSYCTIILNHQKVFKTRTKPKNDKPFFNAGTERFVRDWRTTEVMLSVRDARVHEDDPLLGIVYLPLAHIFRNRSQIMETHPLVGGLGYGRARVSMVFRSVQLQVPKELQGWDYGTLEITGPITSKNLPADLRGLRLKLRSNMHRVKMYSASNDGHWTGKKDRKVRLAVRKRYSSCVVIEFRKNQLAFDKTSAFAVFWLKDIPDDEEKTVSLRVWNGDADMKRAESNCLDKMGASSGTIEVPMKFWHGLSSLHKKHAGSNAKMKDVLEVLDTAYDNKEVREIMVGMDDSDSDDSDDGAERSSTSSERRDKHNQENGDRGPWDQVMDYKDHSDQLHRSHRGVMQWKGARTAKWIKTKVEHGKDHVLNNFKHHHERDSGIETEA